MKHQDAETMNHVPLNINITNPGATQHEFHPRKSKRRTIDRNHNTIGLRRLVVLATIAHAMGMAAIGVEGMNNGSSSSSSLASLRGSVGSTTTTTTTTTTTLTTRKLNFREKSNLFDHETTTNLDSVSQSETIEAFDEEIDRDSGIGAPPDNSELSLPVDSSTDDSNMDESGMIDPSMRYPHDSAQQLLEQEEQEQDSPSSTTTTKNDETTGQQQQQQTQQGFFDGFEIETTSQQQQQQQPTQEGYFDGFEITKTPPNTSDKNIGKVASSYAKRTQDQSNTFKVDLDNHETTISSNTNNNNTNNNNNNRIPHKDVFIFVGLALLSVLLYLVYWRDSILHERIERADENNAKIDRLKNLYEDLDKYSTHMLDDCTLSLSPDHSPTNKNNKTLGKITFSKSMMTRDVDNDSDDGIRNKKSNDNVEHVDFSDDIEFGEESSSQYDDDHPELMMRMVRRNSFQKQHWVKYSSDEFTIDGAEEFFSDDDSLSASERR